MGKKRENPANKIVERAAFLAAHHYIKPTGGSMKAMAYIENIVWALIFFAILWFMDGWAKGWAIAPLLFVNYRKTV